MDNSRIYTSILAAAAFFLTAGIEPEEQLMNEIERHVQLPKGAYPLNDYARYYSYSEAGKVIGIYVIPGRLDMSCKEADVENGGWSSAPCYTVSPNVVGPLEAGKRRWAHNGFRLPFIISDGKCGIVNIIFDPSIRKVEKAFCNDDG